MPVSPVVAPVVPVELLEVLVPDDVDFEELFLPVLPPVVALDDEVAVAVVAEEVVAAVDLEELLLPVVALDPDLLDLPVDEEEEEDSVPVEPVEELGSTQ
jgi:hypothetical protein